MAANLHLVTPTSNSNKCNYAAAHAGGGRKPNTELRPREYLEPGEVERMISAARKTRNSTRDAALVMLMYRHGLRVQEAANLRWLDVDLDAEKIQIRRLKGRSAKASHPAQHPLSGPELRILKQLRRENPACEHVFGGMAKRTMQWTITKLGEKIGLPFPVHAHMLRHALGFVMANKGVDTRTLGDFMGHRSLDSTMIYTQIAPARFATMWED